MKFILKICLVILCCFNVSCVTANVSDDGSQSAEVAGDIDKLVAEIEADLVAWRRNIHQNAELSNREFKTAAKVAAHLKSLGMEVQTEVAHTGVVGILKGGKPGPVIALRADMDALPVEERNDLPFASKQKGMYNDAEVPVMHACGHDTHVAILMATASVLSKMKKDIKGTVKFIFQPAEEGAPKGEEGGAPLMVKEGVLQNPDVDVIFGLHINSQTEVGNIGYTPRGTMASPDYLEIKVNGDQTHGAYPWGGNDPVVISAQIINNLQSIVSRQTDLTKAPAVVTVATIHGGVRNNIIPEEVIMTGTVRNLDEDIRKDVHMRIKRIAEKTAEAHGATAEVFIGTGGMVTYNDPELTEMMVPSLKKAAGESKVFLRRPVMGAEDFAAFSAEVPGLFFFLGGMPKGMDPKDAAPHHTPDFHIDDSELTVGVKAFCHLVMDYGNKK